MLSTFHLLAFLFVPCFSNVERWWSYVGRRQWRGIGDESVPDFEDDPLEPPPQQNDKNPNGDEIDLEKKIPPNEQHSGNVGDDEAMSFDAHSNNETVVDSEESDNDDVNK